MEDDKWRNIPGRKNYQATACGQVRSLDRYVTLRGNLKRKQVGRILAQHSNNYGHLYVTTVFKKCDYVHRCVALAFLPREEGKDIVDHIDGNPANNHVSNLRWCTQTQNVRWGKRARLTESVVEEIRSRYAAGGVTMRDLGKEYNMDSGNVCRIINQQIWKSS